MKIADFIENFSYAINKNKNTTLTSDTNFWELDEWTSLTALSVVSMIDEEYGVALHANDIKGARTIQDLFEVVIKRIQ